MTSADDKAARGAIVLRVGEIFLKGGNRGFFVKRFLDAARRLLSDIEGTEVRAMHLRAMVYHPPGKQKACIARLRRLFGLSSMSPVRVIARDIDTICDGAIDIAKAWPAGTTFKVKTNRRDKQFPMNSMSVSREVGHRVIEATGLPVDVHDPDKLLHVEIDDKSAYLYGDVIEGPGGLAVGSSGRVSLLLSGGIDSPVAGWSAMRRGCRLTAVYFHSFPYTGDKTKEKVLDLATKLAAWHGPLPVHVVHFTDVQKKLREHGRADLAVLLYRRMMMRAATILAKRDDCEALVTGENLAQVASQTLPNLAVIEHAAGLPILRPLIAYDKLEIVERAQAIGTYETSILPYDDCCSLFVPKHPKTSAKLADLVDSEAGLDVEAMARELADGAERIVVPQ